MDRRLVSLVLVGLFAAAGCSLMHRGSRLPIPGDVVFVFTGDTEGELKGCG